VTKIELRDLLWEELERQGWKGAVYMELNLETGQFVRFEPQPMFNLTPEMWKEICRYEDYARQIDKAVQQSRQATNPRR
jgi:hypothetical protein